MNNPLSIQMKATLDRYENDFAVFVLDGGGELQLLKTTLSAPMPEGSIVFLSINDLPHDEVEREQLAKTILNQILKKGGAE